MHAFRFLALANVTLSRCAALSVALVLLAPVEPAGSAVIVTAHPIGGDVVFAGGGQLDTSALTAGGGTQLLFPSITPVASAVFVGGPPVGIRPYGGGGVPVTIPPPFGTGGATLADTGEGDPFGVLGTLIYLPVDYTSGDPLYTDTTDGDENYTPLAGSPVLQAGSAQRTR